MNVLESTGWRTKAIGFIGVLLALAVSFNVIDEANKQTFLDAVTVILGLSVVTIRQAIKAKGWTSIAQGLVVAAIGTINVFNWDLGQFGQFLNSILPIFGPGIAFSLRAAVKKSNTVPV